MCSASASICFESLWLSFWDSELAINSKFISSFLSCFSVEHPSITILPILHLFLKCSAARCAPHSHGSFAAAWVQAEGMVCAQTTWRRPFWRMPCLQHGSRIQWIVGPGSIWVPSFSPWPHPDKKQTNQQKQTCGWDTSRVRAGQTVVSVVCMDVWLASDDMRKKHCVLLSEPNSLPAVGYPCFTGFLFSIKTCSRFSAAGFRRWFSSSRSKCISSVETVAFQELRIWVLFFQFSLCSLS